MAAGNTAAVEVAGGGSVTDPSSNALITLPPNFVTASGPVTVTITGLDPTTDEIAALPGGLQAVDGSGATKSPQARIVRRIHGQGRGGQRSAIQQCGQRGRQHRAAHTRLAARPAGYGNDDPIECYVYDPADGKWKTPVPGVIGPSSVDGQPAIKATIFHLSWYGGAPATSDVACVHGTVRDSLGAPLAGVNVEAFQGERGTTDASGNYQVQAAAHSQVRVVASRLLGAVFQSATDTRPDGRPDRPVRAGEPRHAQPAAHVQRHRLVDCVPLHPDPVYFVDVHIELGVDDAASPVDGATVEVGTGGSFTTVPDGGSGDYALNSLTPGNEGFTLDPGALYTLRLDYNHDGVVDASGQVRMAGLPVVDSPTPGAVEPRSFTTAWSDAGSGTTGYVPLYFGINTGSDSVTSESSTVFFTTERTKLIGSGCPTR